MTKNNLIQVKKGMWIDQSEEKVIMSRNFLRKTITEELGYTPDPELFEHILKEMLKNDLRRLAPEEELEEA